MAGKLTTKARSLYQDDPRAIDWDVPVIAVDSPLIDLSLALCPWANYTGNKAAPKLHAELDLQGPIPAFFNVTTATDSDMGYLETMPIEPGTLSVMDRGYIDFRRLRHLADHGAFFVVRARPDVRFYVCVSGRLIALPRCDPIKPSASTAPLCPSTGPVIFEG